MKLAIVSNVRNSAIDLVMTPLARELRSRGHEVDIFRRQEDFADLTFDGYDLVHFGWIGLAPRHAESCIPPTTANVWSVPFSARSQDYVEKLNYTGYSRVVVDDVTTLQILGQLGFTHVDLIPLAFDYTPFSPLEPPKTEDFVVGIFGNGYHTKRFWVAKEACQITGFRLFSQVTSYARFNYLLDPIQDVYQHIHVLVHSSFVDTNSMPVMEALLCGRPVVATRSHGLERVIDEGRNGYFYDGSSADLASKLRIVQAKYDFMCPYAAKTRMPSFQASCSRYEHMFRAVIEAHS